MKLKINGKQYTLKATIKAIKTLNDEYSNETKFDGFSTAILGLYDYDPMAIVDIINVLIDNKENDTKPDYEEIEEYIEDEKTDIDKVRGDLINFLSVSNVCKKKMEKISLVAEAITKMQAEQINEGIKAIMNNAV